MMGSRPFGNLALTLTVAYFGGLLLTDLLLTSILSGTTTSTVPNTTVQALNISNAGLFGVLILIGIALFFLPLNRVHQRMQAEKSRLLHEIAARYPNLDQSHVLAKGTATLDDVHSGLAKLTNLQELEMLDRKVASLPTWPFDIQLVSKFITIVLSVTAALFARFIATYLPVR